MRSSVKIKEMFFQSVVKSGAAPPAAHPLTEEAPRRQALVALQFGVDDGARSAADGQLLSGLHLVAQVSEPPLRIHLKLLLQ